MGGRHTHNTATVCILIVELEINNDERVHIPSGRVNMMITYVRSTFEVFGNIYWGP
jgi:hypothetical protein